MNCKVVAPKKGLIVLHRVGLRFDEKMLCK